MSVDHDSNEEATNLKKLQGFWNEFYTQFLDATIAKHSIQQSNSLFVDTMILGNKRKRINCNDIDDDIDNAHKKQKNMNGKPQTVINNNQMKPSMSDHLLPILSSFKFLHYRKPHRNTVTICCQCKVNSRKMELLFTFKLDGTERTHKVEYIQYTNKLYDAVYSFINNYDLIHILCSYLPWNDHHLRSKKLCYEIVKNKLREREMMAYDSITFYRKITKNKLRTDYTKFDNNQQYICLQYGVDRNVLLLMLNTVLFMNDPAANRSWYTFQKTFNLFPPMVFVKGHPVDVFIECDNGEQFWTTGHVCKVEKDRVLIHVPRLGGIWKSKLSANIAPTGTYTNIIDEDLSKIQSPMFFLR